MNIATTASFAGGLNLGSGIISSVLALGNASGPVTVSVGELTVFGTGAANEVIGNSTTPSILAVNISSGTNTYSGYLGSGTIGGTNANALALTKTGAGTLILTAANTYTGGTNLGSGTISIYNNSALGTGPLNFTTSGVGTANGSGSGMILATSNVTLSNAINIGNAAAVFNTGGNTITLNGPITNTAGTVAQVIQPTGGGNFVLGRTFNVSGALSDPNNPALLMASNGETTTLSGSGTLNSISLAWYNGSNAGQTGGNGFIIQSAGTVNIAGSMNLGAYDSSYGGFLMTGGNLNIAVNL